MKTKCCKWIRFCKGRLCKDINKKCKSKSVTFSRKCKFIKKGYTTMRRCCSYKKTCNGKRCQKRKIKCGICKKHLVKRIPRKCCKAKPFKNGKNKLRCCSWTRYCKGGKCRNIKIHCRWGKFGKHRKHKRQHKKFHRKCAWKKFFCKKNGKHGKKRRCCNFHKGKRGKCYWVGRSVFFN